MNSIRYIATLLITVTGCSSGSSTVTDATDTRLLSDSGPDVESDDVETANADACSEADLSQCDYPERGLAVTERTGFSVKDPKTGRTLPIVARIPEGEGPFPVVLWSHGGGFNDGGHLLGDLWGEAIAAQGYVVLHMAHVAITVESGKAMCALASIPEAECAPDPTDEDSWVTAVVKTFDVLAVLERLEALSKQSVAEGGPALDLTRVAAAGWSAGARGPQVLMGATLRTTASAPLFTMNDDRIIAAVGLSTAGPGFGGYFDDGDGNTSWSALRGPYLIATGENDVKPNKTDLTGLVRRFPFTAQPADGTRHLLYSKLPVGVGGHGTYNLEDSTSADERLTRLSRALRSSVLAFLDASVKGDAAATAWLATDNAKVIAGEVDWERR
jgi:hypothetical protein